METDQGKSNQSAGEGDIHQQFQNRVIASQLTIRQGGAKTIEANDVTMRQAAALRVNVEQVDASGSALGLVQAQTARLDNSTIAGMYAKGGVTMDQSLSNALVAAGEVNMDQSAAVVLVSKEVKLKSSTTVFLFAQHVEGDVTTLFKSQDAVIFGAVAGLVGGLLMLLSRILRRK